MPSAQRSKKNASNTGVVLPKRENVESIEDPQVVEDPEIR